MTAGAAVAVDAALTIGPTLAGGAAGPSGRELAEIASPEINRLGGAGRGGAAGLASGAALGSTQPRRALVDAGFGAAATGPSATGPGATEAGAGGPGSPSATASSAGQS